MRRSEEVRIIFAAFAIMIAFASLQTCQAKRGCSAFGHSCFGGHGKRMDPSSGLTAAQQSSEPEEMLYGTDQQAGLRDVVFTAPRSDSPALSLLEAAATLQHHRQQDEIEQQKEEEQRRMVIMALRQQEANGMSPFLRQWIQSYRNSQDMRQNNM